MESKGKILVVDEDSIVREMVTRIIEDGDYTALTAKDGKEELHILISGKNADLVISDMNMPGIKTSGYS
jgi:CheY-like chemotaxis protein